MDFDSFSYSDRTVLDQDSQVDEIPATVNKYSAADVWNYLLSFTESDVSNISTYTTALPSRQQQPRKLKHFKATDFDPTATRPRIGGGACYSVDKCTLQPPFGGAIVAVKRLKIFPSSNSTSDSMNESIMTILRELHILTHPPVQQHYNITALLGYSSELTATTTLRSNAGLLRQRVEISLVVEFGPHGTLSQFLGRHKSDLVTKSRLLHDIASGLEALHACGIVQGDVKVENALVFDDKHAPGGYVAKLSDFGHAIVNVDGEDTVANQERYLGTMLLNAPEVRSQNLLPRDMAAAVERAAFYKCDVFSYGLLVWEVVLDGARFLSTLNNNTIEGEYDGEPLAWLDALPKDDLLRRSLVSLQEKAVGERDEALIALLRRVMEATLRDMPSERKMMKDVVDIFRERKDFRDDAR